MKIAVSVLYDMMVCCQLGLAYVKSVPRWYSILPIRGRVPFWVFNFRVVRNEEDLSVMSTAEWQDFKTVGSGDRGTGRPWDCEAVGPWDCETVGPWDRGIARPWDRGIARPWDRATVGPWDRGTVGPCDRATVRPCDRGTVGPCVGP